MYIEWAEQPGLVKVEGRPPVVIGIFCIMNSTVCPVFLDEV